MKRKVSFQFNGKVYTVNVERIGNEIIIEHSGEIYKVNLIEDNQPKNKIESISIRSDLSTSLTPSDAMSYSRNANGTGLLLSPMTGIVNKINVKVGDEVEKGQTVILLEAMKMYVDIHAPKSGVVKEIFVKPGDNISINQKLLKIE